MCDPWMTCWAYRSRSCPNALVTFSSTAPAHPHATGIAVYPALFFTFRVEIFRRDSPPSKKWRFPSLKNMNACGLVCLRRRCRQPTGIQERHSARCLNWLCKLEAEWKRLLRCLSMDLHQRLEHHGLDWRRPSLREWDIFRREFTQLCRIQNREMQLLSRQ